MIIPNNHMQNRVLILSCEFTWILSLSSQLTWNENHKVDQLTPFRNGQGHYLHIIILDSKIHFFFKPLKKLHSVDESQIIQLSQPE